MSVRLCTTGIAVWILNSSKLNKIIVQHNMMGDAGKILADMLVSDLSCSGS